MTVNGQRPSVISQKIAGIPQQKCPFIRYFSQPDKPDNFDLYPDNYADNLSVYQYVPFFEAANATSMKMSVAVVK